MFFIFFGMDFLEDEKIIKNEFIVNYIGINLIFSSYLIFIKLEWFKKD